MRWAVLAGALVVGLAAGCGSSADQATSTSSGAVETTSALATTIVGGTDAQQALIRELLAVVGQDAIAHVEFGAEEAAALDVIRREDSGDVGEWKESLVLQTFADRSGELGLPCISWGETRGGGVALGCGDGELPTACAGFSEDDAVMLAKAYGADLESYEHLIVAPARDAYAVQFFVTDAPSFLRDWMEPFVEAVNGATGACFADYILVTDGQAEPVYRSWSVVSDSLVSSESGVREDLRGCWAPPMLGDEPPPQPPCPVD